MSAVRVTLLAVAALAVAGCGSTTFTAEEMVAEINRHGGQIELGPPLPAQGDEIKIYSLRLTGDAETPEDVHAAGTLLIAGGDETALAEYHRCEGSASLVCFRAANAVLVFEGAVPQTDLARVGHAIRAMASD